MATNTTNYNLVKPVLNETADIEVINSNMDIIDLKLKENNDKSLKALNLLDEKQNSSDSSLTTSAKTIVGAINELDKELEILYNTPNESVKSVQRGTYYPPNQSSSIHTVSISAVNLNKSILLINYLGKIMDSYKIGIAAKLNATSITINMSEYIGNGVIVEWQVIEFY